MPQRMLALLEGAKGRRIRAALAATVCLLGLMIYAQAVAPKYPIGDWLFWRIGRVWGYVLWFNVACVSVGHLLLRRVFRLKRLPVTETFVMSMALGLATFVLGLYLGGTLGQFKPWFGIALPTVLTAVGLPEMATYLSKLARARRLRFAVPWSLSVSALAWLAVAWSVMSLGVLYLQSMTPDAINFDASWYHIPIAQDYARAGKIVRFPSDYNRAFPHLPSMCYTWGYIVPGLTTQLRWTMALHLEYAMVVWKVIGVAAGARWMLGGKRLPALWTGFFLFPSIFVHDQNLGGSADHFMGFWCIPIFLAAVRAIVAFDPRFCALLGVTVGGAMLTKYQAVYMIAAVGVLIIGRWIQLAVAQLRKQDGALPWKTLVRGPLWIAGIGLLVGGPHFLKNAIFYHNPIYPMAQDIFASDPTHERSAFFFKYMYPNQPWVPKGTRLDKIVTGAKLFFSYSFAPHYSFVRNYLTMGSLFTILLPCALFLRRTGRIWLGIIASFFAMQAWANTYIVDRYLQGIMPLFAIVTVALIVKLWHLGWLARAGLVPLIAFQLIWGGDAMFYSGHKRIARSISLITSGFDGRRSDAQRWPQRRAHLAINKATPPDARIVTRNYRTTLGIDRVILSDIQAWQAYFYFEPLKGPRGLYDLYKSKGVTHILFPRGRRASMSKQLNVLFAELIYRHCKKGKRYGGLELVDMPTMAPPPDSAPYEVVVVGIRGYPDGLYNVEQLHLYERIPAHLRYRPKPLKPLPKAVEDLEEMLEGAEAILTGRRWKKLQPVSGKMGRDFVVAEKFSGFHIRLRR